MVPRRKSVTFAATVAVVGNSLMVRISSTMAEKLSVGKGDDVDVTIALPELIIDGDGRE